MYIIRVHLLVTPDYVRICCILILQLYEFGTKFVLCLKRCGTNCCSNCPLTLAFCVDQHSALKKLYWAERRHKNNMVVICIIVVIIVLDIRIIIVILLIASHKKFRLYKKSLNTPLYRLCQKNESATALCCLDCVLWARRRCTTTTG